MWKLGLGIVIFQKKMLGTALSMWTDIQLLSAKYCNLLRKTKLQNAYSSHTPHSGLGRGEKKQLVRAELSLHVLSWTQRANALEPPMLAMVRPPGSVSLLPQHTQPTDCSFMKWKCPRKRKCEGGVLSDFFLERGEQKNRPLHLDIENEAWASV